MDLPLTDPRPVGRILADQAARYGDKPFLLFEDQVISYRTMHERACRCAAGLYESGIRKGDKIGILVSNRPEFLDAVYGILTMGAVEVPINTAYKGDLLAYIIDHSDAKAIIVEGEFLQRLDEIQGAIPKIEHVWVIDESARVGLTRWSVRPFEMLARSSGSTPEVEIKPSDLAGIVYTSGTTGPSKGVMCTHHYFYNFSAAWSAAIRLMPEDIYYTSLPYFHFAAQVGTTYTSLVTGATVVMGRHFSANNFWDSLRCYRATGATLLGSLCHILLKAPPSPKDRDHCVRFFWTAPAPAAIHAEFQERFGVKLLEGYGMTETNIPLQTPYDAPRRGSCGKPWGAFDVDIVDDDDWPVPPGVVGEIVTRPNLPWSMMSGYYRMPEKTAEAFRNLWFHTGDRGHKDEEGYFYFDDRKKDSIRRRGENISSYEIERLVDSHSSVLESAVVAVPADLGEDDVKMVVVLQPGADLRAEDLIAFCASRMAYFMVPRYVEFAAELPKTPNGKVQKHKLRAEGLTARTWDREAAGLKINRTGT
jgi:crotonobetaine/carnitine-CoA ligase